MDIILTTIIYIGGKLKYSIRNYEEVFNKEYEDTREELIESLRDKDISKYRVKTIKSGDMLECEIYPIWNSSKKKRCEKLNTTSKAQKNLNDRNTKKNIIRLMNTNFSSDDMWATFTYDADCLPEDETLAKRDMQNYIRRLKRIIKKNDLEDLKYIYVTEYEDDPQKGKKRVHHHVVMNFKDRDIAEKVWDKGGRTHSRRLQPDDYGLEGMARYITKDPKNSKRYTTSRNLKKPTITVADSKMTKRRAEKIAKNCNDSPVIFEKWYQGYNFNDIEIKLSEFVSGTYMYVRMKKINGYCRNLN